MKILIAVLLLVGFTTIPLYAGDPVTLPYNVVVGDPLTDKAERVYIKFFWDGEGAKCELAYEIWNNDRTILLDEYATIVTGQDLIDLTAGYASTMLSRTNVIMSDHLKTQRTWEAKP